jgi:hypothetical protein
MCSLRLVSIVHFVWPIYDFPHSHGMPYTPGIFTPGSYFSGLSMWQVFYVGTCMVLMSYLDRSLLILLEVDCWYGRSAVAVGFSLFYFCFLQFCLRMGTG